MRAKPSAYFKASVLGVISPKIKIKKVRPPVINPSDADPNTRMPHMVATIVAKTFTKLLPSKIAINKPSGRDLSL